MTFVSMACHDYAPVDVVKFCMKLKRILIGIRQNISQGVGVGGIGYFPYNLPHVKQS